MRYDGHGRMLAGTSVSGASVAMRFNFRGQLTEYTSDGLSMRFQWTAFGQLQRIDGPGSDLVIYEYDAAQRLIGVRKSLATTAARSDSTLTQFAKALRKALELPMATAYAQVLLPPISPVPGGALGGLGIPRPPVSTYPGDVLVPSQSADDPNRELARRLGDSVQAVIKRLFCSPECKLLQAQIEVTVNEIRWRHFSMVVDKNNLFCAKPEGRGSWRGHQQQYGDKQTLLRKLLSRAKASSCPYNPEADDWADRPAPTCPG
jgi:YD repeat-containing protein